MARESGRLGLLQDTGATNTSRARESILWEPVPRPAGTREGEAGSQASGPPAHPCEPGLPIVNIYLTSVTPARHRCLPPPPLPVTPPTPPSPAPGRGRAAASLPSGHGAPGCGCGCAPQPAWCGRCGRCGRCGSCGRCGRCALRAALLLPGGRPDALQINAVAFLESERGRAKRTQTPPVTAAIPCAPHHICLPQQQQQRSERASEGARERREGGSQAGGGELSSARAGLRVAGCVWLASATPGSSSRCSLCAAAAGARQRAGGLRESARGREAADTLASRGEPRRALVLWPRGPPPTAGSFICSWEPAADGGTLRPCAV